MTETVTLNELLATRSFILDKIKSLEEERNSLPRNDKQNAHRLLTEINKLKRESQDLKPTIARVRGEEERRDSHSLWVSCIRELYGAEDLAICLEWMKQERKARRAQA